MTSTIGVKKIQHTNGTQVMTFDTAGKISSNITTTGTINTPSINGGQIGGRRNIVINGAMQVAQRGTSFTSVAGSAYHLDRYRTGMGDTSARFTVTQATAGLNGFGNSLKYDCTTAESSLSSADARLFVTQRIEGQNLQQLKKGTSDAEKFTVSFYVKSTKTGTYILNIVDIDNNRQISQAYTISSSGTWEQKTLTFDGDTTGALGNDNGNSFELHWWLIAGTSYSSGSLATSWTTYAGASDYTKSAVGNVNLGDNTSNTWEITGIQMELGETATAFEHRPVAEELSLCQRYYIKTNPEDDTRMSGFTGCMYTTTQAVLDFVFPVEMRAAPSVSIGGSNNNYWIAGVNGSASGTIAATQYKKNMAWWELSSVSTCPSNGYQITYNGQVDIDAEL